MKVIEKTFEINIYTRDQECIAHDILVNRDDEDYLQQLSVKYFHQKCDVQWRAIDGYERSIFDIMSYEHGDYIGYLQVTTWQKWR